MENQTELSTNISSEGTETTTPVNLYYAPPWALIAEVIYLCVIILIGIPGNSLILMVQLKSKARTTTDYYVITMAVVELLCSCLSTSMRIFVNTETVWKLMASAASCSFRQFTRFITTISSSFLLAGIAVDRYMKTCKPLNTSYTTKIAKRLCFAIIIAGIITCLHTIGTYELDVYLNCVLRKQTATLKKIMDMINILLTITVYIITSAAYLNISLVLRQRHKNRVQAKMNASKSTTSSEIKSTKQMFTGSKVSPAPGNTSAAGDKSNTPVSVRQPVTQTTAIGISSESNHCPASTNRHLLDVAAAPSGGPSFSGQPTANVAQQAAIQSIRYQQQTLNRTTRIMFLISAVYMSTWLISWLRVIFGAQTLGPVVDNFARSLYMVNCVTNPLFFFFLSSKFRESASRLIMCR